MFKEVSLVYFSSTKTTQRTVRAIGRALAKAFDIPVQEYDFTLPNARSRKLHFASDQLVVVGSPVYGGVMPLLVREYLAQYVTGEKTACILAAVYGNRNFDDCLVEMQDLMEENGFVVTAAAACIGEHSYSTAIASGRPNAQDLALAEEFGRQVAQKLSASPAVPTLAQTLPGSRPYRERKPSAPMAPQTTNGCIRCGMCVNNCPVGAIDPTATTQPRWMLRSVCVVCPVCGCARLAPKLLPTRAFKKRSPGVWKTSRNRTNPLPFSCNANKNPQSVFRLCGFLL